LLDKSVRLAKTSQPNKKSFMQKLTITAIGTYLVDVKPGHSLYLATSGTIAATIKYLTAPGVYQAFTAPLSLSAEQTVINYGAHSEMAIVVTGVTPSAIIIANPQPLQ
jgi:hypothetical protein